MRAVRTIRFLGFSDTGAPRHSPRDCSTTKLSSSSDLLLPQLSDLKYGVQGDLPSIEFKSWRSISRREERQLEQQFGPLWRYHVLARHGNAPSEATLPVSRDGLGAVVEAATSPTMVASTAPHTSDTPLSNNGNSDDPLAVFIERNEEEAAVLLAMWTSLKRSCFYGSEISEQLSLRVRYIFHTLLHNNAVGAAWALYERLVHVGVSLRHNDLILLLTSLPYESAADRATVEKWIKEEQKKREGPKEGKGAEGGVGVGAAENGAKQHQHTSGGGTAGHGGDTCFTNHGR
ncbi:hypothetical protein AGDE_15058 [Angomonas deanei]|uniref:Uncharacterized protein n=1 Tax=Angomonas deanei TaxID=59799 RepID=A0A7G2C5Z6_9TRYP|nr:hypothetical protein AGDE_15058 [Angomonas deanei]CAD2214193.1 hypothetical protein, conserved [Angomonas deanei]|eukprot:EPY19752.1 hypothetical protein AGDE_15058 [Angomonas deanei]